jgi:hypothetical protein
MGNLIDNSIFGRRVPTLNFGSQRIKRADVN